jgi:hypothetical protein
MRKVRSVKPQTKDFLSMTSSFEDPNRTRKSLPQTLKPTDNINLSISKSPYLAQFPKRRRIPLPIRSLSKGSLLSNSMCIPKAELSFTNYSPSNQPKNIEQDLEFRATSFSFCADPKSEPKGFSMEINNAGLETQKNIPYDANMREVIELDVKLSQIIENLLIVNKSKISAEDLVPILNILEKDIISFKPINSILHNLRRLLQYLSNDYMVRIKEVKHQNEQLKKMNQKLKAELSYEKDNVSKLEYKIDILSQENQKLTQKHDKVIKQIDQFKTHGRNRSILQSDKANERLMQETHVKSEIIRNQKFEIQHLRQNEVKLTKLLEEAASKGLNSSIVLDRSSSSPDPKPLKRSIVPPLRLSSSVYKDIHESSSYSEPYSVLYDTGTFPKDSDPSFMVSNLNRSIYAEDSFVPPDESDEEISSTLRT